MPLAGVPVFALDRRNVLHLAVDQSISLLSLDDGVWTDDDPRTELRDGRIMSVFSYESSWSWWERHPVGTELVFVLSGAVVFHLEEEAGERSVSLAAGECVLVPEGAWHRAEIATRASMLFVTPSPARTEHRAA